MRICCLTLFVRTRVAVVLKRTKRKKAHGTIFSIKNWNELQAETSVLIWELGKENKRLVGWYNCALGWSRARARRSQNGWYQLGGWRWSLLQTLYFLKGRFSVRIFDSAPKTSFRCCLETQKRHANSHMNLLWLSIIEAELETETSVWSRICYEE